MKQKILGLILSGALATGAFAASINQRAENQQQRIAAGIRDRQLSAHQVANLESREARVNREVRFDRTHDDGHLTGRERFNVDRQQNRLSRSIYLDRHYR